MQKDSEAGRLAASKGAVTQQPRFGAYGARVGTDYLDANGNIVLQAMTAVGNPQ